MSRQALRRGGLALLPGLVLVPGAPAQPRVQTVQGVVRELGSTRVLAGAEVIVGTRSATSNQRGAFRLDSVPLGQYALTVRLIGYRPLRGTVPVVAKEPTELVLHLIRSPYVLPALIVESSNRGLYGTVGDSALLPLVEARVAVLGVGGREVLTDSAGRFAVPEATGGTYMVRVSKPGYAERHIVLDLPKGAGRELSFRLANAGRTRFAPGMANAYWDLDRRLAFEFRRTRMTPDELERYTTLALCDVPRVRSQGGEPTTVIVNGTLRLEQMTLCAWRADEVELIEFCSQMKAMVPPLNRGSALNRSRGSAQMMGKQSGCVYLWEKQ